MIVKFSLILLIFSITAFSVMLSSALVASSKINNFGLEYNALWSGAMLSQKDMTEAITANMEKRDASFNDLVEVKKFNESDS